MARPVRVEIPVPFPIGTVNAWLWPGNRPALWDCGIGGAGSYRLLRDAMREAGVGAGATLYVSHGHVDHAGNAAQLRDDLGIPLHAPRQEAPFVETFCRDSQDRNDRYAAALLRHGMPEADVARVRARSERIDAHTRDTPIAAHVPDGEAVLLGDTEAQAVWTPGHTPGSLVLLTEDNHLLSGDTLLEGITSNAIELLPEDHGRHHQYVATLEGLRRFVGCTVLPGHHAPFDLGHGVLDRHMDRYQKRSGRILEALDRPRTAWDLLPRIFPTIGEDQHFLAMADIVGHLHALEIDGRAHSAEKAGHVRFRRS